MEYFYRCFLPLDGLVKYKTSSMLIDFFYSDDFFNITNVLIAFF